MTKRLIWNFEIDTSTPVDFKPLQGEKSESLRWESRFFWPDDQPIILHGLNESFLNLGLYDFKERHDVYYLLPDDEPNIKLRRGELWYKPRFEASNHSQSFGKKLALADCAAHAPLPGMPHTTAEELLNNIKQKGKTIAIDKVAVLYKFPTSPTTKLELARCNIENVIYFTVCVEGRSKTLVEEISQHLIKGNNSCDYVYFLKHKILHDH